MKKLHCALILLTLLMGLTIPFSTFSIAEAESGTQVSGIISLDTTWTLENSPYIVTDTIQIPNNVILTIEPGVTIESSTSNDLFLLLGKICGHGTLENPITFDGDGKSTIIGTFPGYGYGDFQYCIFKNAYCLWNRWGHIDLRHSLIVDISSSEDAVAGAIIQLDGPSGESNIEYNAFINTGGIYSYDDRYGVNVRYNLFEQLTSPLYHAGGGTPSNPPKEMIVHFNSFIDITGLALSLAPGFFGWSPNIDATENYWGTFDPDIIEQKIYDSNDDVSIENSISYLPILADSDPNIPTDDPFPEPTPLLITTPEYQLGPVMAFIVVIIATIIYVKKQTKPYSLF